MRANHVALVALAVLLLGLLAVGCSENPVTPSSGVNSLSAVAGGPVQFSARVATMDQARRMLAFAGQSDTIIANENCEVVRLQNGLDVAAQFGEIKVGDSVQVYGNREQSRLVYAYRLRICNDTGNGHMIAGRIRTTERTQLMFTLVGKPDTVIAGQTCQMVRWQNGGETQIQFGQLRFGDSVEVTGQMSQNGYMYATKVKLCGDRSQCQYDIAFRDTITAIDYTAGTITVKNRVETILVDSSTLIWGVITRLYENTPEPAFRGQLGASASDGGSKYLVSRRDTVLLLSDLAVGDIIEVRAKIIDANTLLAVHITLAACSSIEKKCVEFTAPIATLDVETRVVTFDGLSWIGQVCPGAQLTDAYGQAITLDQFAIGDLVAVKGFPLEGDTLKICRMSITAL